MPASCDESRLQLADRLLADDPDVALQHYADAFAAGCTQASLFENLAGLLIQGGRFEEAWRVCVAGLKWHPKYPGLLGNSAVALAHLGYYQEALDCLVRQRIVTNGKTRSSGNLGNVLRALGRLDESIAAYGDSENEKANLALAYLLKGDLAQGFALFEQRTSLRRNSLPGLPFWKGETTPRELALYRDQGVGDIFQCARYIPLLNQRGITPVLAISPHLGRLFQQLQGCRYRLAFGPEQMGGVTEQCAWFSLPHLLGTTIENIPEPIVFRTNSATEEMRERSRVALIWAGNPEHQNDHNRSLPLSVLEPIWSQADIQFLSLQMGKAAGQIGELGLGGRIVDLSGEIEDYADTAAILAQVDLVITVDTSVAHLAGTQGVPVWTMIPFAPDWRWMLHREDSPWYPSMRLFRQSHPRDWESVMGKVAESLRAFVARPAERVAARFLKAKAGVLDLHAGETCLPIHLNPATPYTGCNITAEELPDETDAEHIVMLGVLDQLDCWQDLLMYVRRYDRPLTFSDTRVAPEQLSELVHALARAGFALRESAPVSAGEAVFHCVPVSPAS